eukprot:SAG22_NODE_491_length_9827_cov_6.501028_5_plen_70_part_00
MAFLHLQPADLFIVLKDESLISDPTHDGWEIRLNVRVPLFCMHRARRLPDVAPQQCSGPLSLIALSLTV